MTTYAEQLAAWEAEFQRVLKQRENDARLLHEYEKSGGVLGFGPDEWIARRHPMPPKPEPPKEERKPDFDALRELLYLIAKPPTDCPDAGSEYKARADGWKAALEAIAGSLGHILAASGPSIDEVVAKLATPVGREDRLCDIGVKPEPPTGATRTMYGNEYRRGLNGDLEVWDDAWRVSAWTWDSLNAHVTSTDLLPTRRGEIEAVLSLRHGLVTDVGRRVIAVPVAE